MLVGEREPGSALAGQVRETHELDERADRVGGVAIVDVDGGAHRHRDGGGQEEGQEDEPNPPREERSRLGSGTYG